MIVLKKGKPNYRKFICTNCECEFVAGTHEYWRKEQFGVIYYECDCPHCTYTTQDSEPWEEENV